MAKLRGGERLAIALAEIATNLSKPATLRVGFLEGATGPDGDPIAMRAAINEFGAPAAGIPPRPFFRNMIAAKSGEWPDAIAGLLKDHNYDAALTLNLAGEAIASQLQQSIKDTNSPALAPSTIERKGFAKPLIETGDMLRAVDHEVKGD
ncbi:hypothetical protein [Bradyrhizobium oropedii]|uniref:hypothetical protein n=1 Tax=Bradyrhizobium oropedii TaxID=1571201 RepID=UPI001E6220EF|nr:hypothetical protein [Bradyrhizobium oropedii]